MPYKAPEEVKQDDSLLELNFDKVFFEEQEDGSVYFEYEAVSKRGDGSYSSGGSGWDNFSVKVTKNGAITGLGYRRHRKWIVYVFTWYKIAKKEINTNFSSDFIDTLIFEPLS